MRRDRRRPGSSSARILTPIVVAVIAPTLPPRGRDQRIHQPGLRQTPWLFGIVTPDPPSANPAVYFRLHAGRLQAARRRARAGRASRPRDNPGVHIPWLMVTTTIVLFPGRVRHGRACPTAGGGRRAGAEPPRFNLSGGRPARCR